MGQYKKLWYLLFAVTAVCFTILGYMGSEVYKKPRLTLNRSFPHQAKC